LLAVAAVVAAAFVAAAAVAESCQLPHKYAYYPYRVFVSLGHTNAVAKALWEDMLLLSRLLLLVAAASSCCC